MEWLREAGAGVRVAGGCVCGGVGGAAQQLLLSGCGISGWEGQFYRHTGVVVARQGARADTTGCTLENS